MNQPIQTYLEMSEDKYRPSNPNLSLQRYDNYCIYDIYSIRIFTDINIDNIFNRKEEADTRMLAVQHYSITKPTCDFNEIVQEYQ